LLIKYKPALPSYNSYHTNLILLHKFNSLPDEFKSIIPYSTLSSWNKRNIETIIGCDTLADKDIKLLKQIVTSKKLLLAAKALYFVFSTVSTLFKNANNKAELLKDHKILILNTISKVRSSLGVKRVLKWIGISPAKMYYWLEERNCQLSISKLCRSTHPNQLLDKEVQTIKDYLLNNRYKNWSALSIYYQALKDQALFISIETWYKYARKLGIKRKFFKLKYKREIGLRATSPLQILHMDVTIFKPLDHSRVYIYFIIDNFSRTILNWNASLEYSSSIAMKVLKEAIKKHNIELNTSLITDGGAENQGEVSRFIEGKENITKLIAQKDIIQSNSMVEAVNKHVKYYYLFKKDLKDYQETVNYLKRSISDYNQKPHGALFGLTPGEVLNGEIPSSDQFRVEKLRARQNRVIMNQKIKCCKSN